MIGSNTIVLYCLAGSEGVCQGRIVSEWFPGIVRLRQGCAMFSRLFNVHIDGVVREVNAGPMLGKELELLRANGGWFEIN